MNILQFRQPSFEISHFESIPYLGRHLWRARVHNIWVADFEFSKAAAKAEAIIEALNTPSNRCASTQQSAVFSNKNVEVNNVN